VDLNQQINEVYQKQIQNMFSQANYKELFKMNSAHEQYSKKYSEVSSINSLDE
jgi:hypothetical protein